MRRTLVLVLLAALAAQLDAVTTESQLTICGSVLDDAADKAKGLLSKSKGDLKSLGTGNLQDMKQQVLDKAKELKDNLLGQNIEPDKEEPYTTAPATKFTPMQKL
jgi:hypothetical protein